MSAQLYLPLQADLNGQSPTGSVTATASDPARFADGGGVFLETSTTNLVLNPVLGVDASNISGVRATVARDATVTLDGYATAKVTVNADTSGFQGANFTTPTQTASVPHANQAIIYHELGSDRSFRLGGATGGTLVVVPSHTPTAASGVLTLGVTKAFVEVRFDGTATIGDIFWVTAVQVEQRASVTTLAHGALGDGYAWTGSAHASTSTRTASTLTIPLSGAWGSVAFRYHEGGAWQEGYLTADGAIGTYGSLAHDGSDFTISTTRQLTIGPFMVFDRALTGTERDQLFGRNNWSLDVLSRITPNGLFLPL